MSVADITATLLLSPLLLAQAVRVRKIALQLPEAAGPHTGIRGSGPALRVLIIGDSLQQVWAPRHKRSHWQVDSPIPSTKITPSSGS